MKKPEPYFDEDGNPCTRFVNRDPLTITEGWLRYKEIRRKLARELLTGRDNIVAHGVDIPEANGWLESKLREIAEEGA